MKLYKVVPVLAIAALTISVQLSTSCNRYGGTEPLVQLARVAAPAASRTGADAAEDLETLDVLSYNVFMRPGLVGWGDENTCRAGAIADAFIERAKSLDIVALNESFDTTAVEHLTERLGDHFPYRALQKPEGDWLEINGGLSILSKHPIRRIYSKTFGECAFADCMTAKGFLHAVVDVSPDLTVNVLATHLDAGDSTWDEQSRRAQIGKIREYVTERELGRDRPTLLVGDLNVDGIRGPASRYDGGEDEYNEYGAMLARLAPTCADCAEGDCASHCTARPTDTATLGRGPWRFTASETGELNSMNCVDQTLAPCRSPNDRAHWRRRERLDYILNFPAEGRQSQRLRAQHSEFLPLASDACGTNYLSDHQAIRTTFAVTPGAPRGESLSSNALFPNTTR